MIAPLSWPTNIRLLSWWYAIAEHGAAKKRKDITLSKQKHSDTHNFYQNQTKKLFKIKYLNNLHSENVALKVFWES